MSSDDLLELRGLCVQAGERTLLGGVSLSLDAGRMVALVGASGSGKTLTARALAGLLDLRPGVVSGSMELLISGARWSPYSGDAATAEATFSVLRGAVITWMPQEASAALDPVWTVGRQIDAVLRAAHPGRSPDAAERHAALAAVGFSQPAEIAALYPHELSGGMAQRVVIALAFARRTRFLLADEPTTGLDPNAAAGVLRSLSALRDRGVGVLLITHDLRLVPRWCDDLVVMAQGRVVETLPATSLELARSPEARALLSATARIAGGLL